MDSELKKTRATEAEACKRKTKHTTDDALPTKKRKRKKRDQAASTEPLVVEPISVARPASEHRERRLVVHEPASTEAPEAEENPAVDPPQLKTLVLTTMLKMMKSFLRSSTIWYHRLFSQTANSSALVVH